MDENKTWQKLAAEFLGTAFLVFVGVGSVAAERGTGKHSFRDRCIPKCNLGTRSLPDAALFRGCRLQHAHCA